MIKLNVSGSMMGYTYPFFLSNGNLTSAYYQYAIYSPGLNEDCIPYISLTKISEKVKNDPSGKDIDILSALSSESEKAQVGLISGFFKKEEDYPEILYVEDKFPFITMQEGLNIQKSLIINLRDSLRWKNYRFTAGRYIDVLWTPTEFVVFRIQGEGTSSDKETLWLEPVGVYKNTDIELKNPLNVDLSKVDFPKDRFSKEAGKISEINRMIKKLEWGSFDRKNFVD